MSLRSRLLLGMALVAAVLAVAAVAITRITHSNLIGQVDAELVNAAGRYLGPGGPGPEGPRDQGGPHRFSALYVGVVDGDSVQTVLTPDLAAPALPAVDGAAAVAAAQNRRPFTVGSATGDTSYRALAQEDRRTGDTWVFALPLGAVDETVDRLVLVEVIATGLIMGVLGLVAWWVIRLGVRPIKLMTATATAIAGGDLSHRVPEGEAGTEAGDLGDALNTMLGTIQDSLDQRARSEDRLRQFVADASHELRTPVTTIRGYAELYRAGGLADPSELGEAMRRTEQEAVRMSRLVDDLLVLARLDQHRPLDRSRIDLDALARDAVRDARAVDPERSITAATNGPVTVVGDPERLRQVIANLVGNALVHTPPGTPIELRVHNTGDRAVLEVVDHGPGMADDVANRAFERFYRADPSRSRHRGGSGLGLAIAQAAIGAHGGAITIDSTPGAGTTVRVELPGDA